MKTTRSILAVPFFVVAAHTAVAQQTTPEYLARKQILSPPDLPTTARFGHSMDAEGGILVVGAPSVPGSTGGMAIVFERSANGSWTEVQRLFGTAAAKSFGYDVAISGERIVVGSDNTGAWVFDRQVGGAWTETTWLGILPGLGGHRVAVEDEVVVSADGAFTFLPGFPGFDIWEEQPNGSWTSTPNSNVNPMLMFSPYGDISIDGGVIVASYSYPNSSCVASSTRSSTAAYVRDSSGWVLHPPLSFQWTWKTASMVYGNGHLVTAGGYIWSYGPCPTPGDICGYCYEGYTWVVDTTNPAGPDDIDAGVYTSWPSTPPEPLDDWFRPLDIESNRLVALSVNQHGTHVFLQELPDNFDTPDAAIRPIGYVKDPLAPLTTTSSSSLRRQLVQVDDQDVFVSKWDEGRGVVHVFGEANFAASSPTVSLGGAGEVALSLDVGPSYAGRPYMILGSATGIAPGVALAHAVTIPLIVDGYTYYTLDGAPHIVGQTGNFDSAGRKVAAIDVPPGFSALAGITIHHAFVWYDPSIFAIRASAPVSTLLVP